MRSWWLGFTASEKSAETAQELPLIKKFALPNDFNSESEGAHFSFFACIARLVTRNLVGPPSMVGSRKSRKCARFVSVPKASVNEHAPSSRFVCDVWTPWEFRRANPEACTDAV
jgi:hypothetical protein